MPRRRVVSRTIQYTKVRCLCRKLPAGEPVELIKYLEGEWDNRKAYRKLRKQLPADIKLIRAIIISTTTELLSIPINKFIELCKMEEEKNGKY